MLCMTSLRRSTTLNRTIVKRFSTGKTLHSIGQDKVPVTTHDGKIKRSVLHVNRFRSAAVDATGVSDETRDAVAFEREVIPS